MRVPCSGGPSRGFTLIEMIVTIGIIILAAGFMAPAIATMFQNRKLENAGSMISNTLQEARTNAVTQRQSFRVVFLQDGLRLYREPKREDPGGFEGAIKTYDSDNSGTLSYELVFAKMEYEDIPKDLYVILDDPDLEAKEWVITPGDDVSIRFLPDGSIDMGGYINSSQDIIIRRTGETRKYGAIDIKRRGDAKFEVIEIEEEE